MAQGNKTKCLCTPGYLHAGLTFLSCTSLFTQPASRVALKAQTKTWTKRSGEMEITKPQTSGSKTPRKRRFREGGLSYYQKLPRIHLGWGMNSFPLSRIEIAGHRWPSSSDVGASIREAGVSGNQKEVFGGREKVGFGYKGKSYGTYRAEQPQRDWRARNTLCQEAKGVGTVGSLEKYSKQLPSGVPLQCAGVFTVLWAREFTRNKPPEKPLLVIMGQLPRLQSKGLTGMPARLFCS